MNEALERVRARLRKWTREHCPEYAELPCEECIVLRGDRLRGYRFAIGEVVAVWLVGEATADVRSPRASALIVVDDTAGTTGAKAA